MRNTFRRRDTFMQYLSGTRKTSRSHKTFILCPGQSSQYVGMMKKVDINNIKLEEMMNTANKILGYDIVDICEHGPQQTLTRTMHCQPGVVIATLLAFEKLKDIVKTST